MAWWWSLAALTGCHGEDALPADSATTEPAPREVPWTHTLPPLEAPRGQQALRTIVHLHSPWSHDACDGDPLPDGVVNEPCLQDLRAGLCEAGIDVAFVTDHPAFAADQTWDALFHAREGDERVDGVANRIRCDDGRTVTWMPGIEDELMPVGLDRHVAGDDFAENDRIYNGYDAETVAAERAAGASVFVAHTEQRDVPTLSALQDAGIAGVEVFNLHAMFAPDIREEWLGLDGLGWVTDAAPFTSPEGTAEPDLLVLAVLQAQPPSLAAWDALLQRGPAVGIGGTDAHQNVLPIDLRDGRRGDGYARMLRWFANIVWADTTSPAAVQDALAAGRSHLVFEILGSEQGFDFDLRDADGGVHEMGSAAPAGTLEVGCPSLHPASPRGLEDPEITVSVLKDGAPWREGCGAFETDGPGVYRVEVQMVPWHLRGFLGDDPEVWLHAYPWIYGNAIRVQ
ncbi:MAG: hypothetical protein R3F59_32580 [Myxococcota bacterium]